MMEFLAKGVAERNARDLLAGDRVAHNEIIGKYRERADRRDQAERSSIQNTLGRAECGPISLNSAPAR